MRRGPKPAKSKEAKPPGTRKSRKNDGARLRDLEKRLAEALSRDAEASKREAEARGQLRARDRELVEAREQQTATSEILAVIRRSPMDAQPVFDVIIRNAVRLCDGLFGCLFRFDGERLHLVAHYNFTAEALSLYERTYPVQAARDQLLGPIVLERRVMNVADVLQGVRNPLGQKLFGFRSGLGVPMKRDGTVIGAIAVSRTTVGLFPDTQVELLQTFADQAVIAIENVRLFNETKEALEQQTATSEILRVISSSPTDIQPVFDAIVARATNLCGALFSALFRFDGELLHFVAHHNFPAEAVEAFNRDFPARPEGTTTARAILERRVVNVADVLADPTQSPKALARAQALGYRSILAVPMFREGQVIGTIAVVRLQVGGFTDKQVGLLQTFAKQAVIAIENVRLFNETKAALHRQTATSEILRVISSSPTDVQPVFDTIVQNAVRLCDGLFGSLDRFDGDLIYPAATHNYTPDALDAMHRVFPARPSRSLGVGRAILDRDVVHIPDVELDPEYKAQNLAGTIGFRSGLFVPINRTRFLWTPSGLR
jgi:two-component system, NtrC family, sensor kinase